MTKERTEFYKYYNRARIMQGDIREFPNSEKEFYKYLNSKYSSLEDFVGRNIKEILSAHIGCVSGLDWYAEKNHGFEESVELKTHFYDLQRYKQIVNEDYLTGDADKCLEVIELAMRYYRAIVNNSMIKKDIRALLADSIFELKNIREINFLEF